MPRHAVIIDAKVGRRVTLRRRQLKISQTALGKAVGVTFQQIQKYESGKNRIPSGRLVHIARAMDVPVAWFFENALSPEGSPKANAETRKLEAFLQSRDGITLALAFSNIANQRARRRIAAAIVSMIDIITGDKAR